MLMLLMGHSMGHLGQIGKLLKRMRPKKDSQARVRN